MFMNSSGLDYGPRRHGLRINFEWIFGATRRVIHGKNESMKRKGCGAHHQRNQQQDRTALRFARVPMQRKECGAHQQRNQEQDRAPLRFARFPKSNARVPESSCETRARAFILYNDVFEVLEGRRW
jgi:hypothetical protein